MRKDKLFTVVLGTKTYPVVYWCEHTTAHGARQDARFAERKQGPKAQEILGSAIYAGHIPHLEAVERYRSGDKGL